MDPKPNNILLDNDGNAILIDWKQCGASPFFLAPEADDSWDAEPQPRSRADKQKLVISQVCGSTAPESRRMASMEHLPYMAG